MKKLFLISFFTLHSSLFILSGQPKSWTLAECIDYAVENNIDVQRTELEVESAELSLNSTRSSRLPTLNAGLGHSFSFGRSIGEQNTYEDHKSMNTSLNASADVTVFEGFRINNQVKADKLDLKAAAAGLERVKESVELGVAGYYLDVLFKKEVLAVYRTQTELTRQQVENTRAMVETGKVAASQLLDIEAQLGRNIVSEVGAQNDLELSLLNLAQALNLPQTEGFDVADVDTQVGFVPLRTAEEIYATALDVKPQVRQAEFSLESAERGVAVAKAGYWPSLRLGASVSDGYYYMFDSEITQEDFGSQFRNKHGENVGVNLSIPIFNGNRTRNNVRGARLQARNSALQLDEVKLALYKEIQQAWQSAVAARARFEATDQALVAAEEAFRAMEVRYGAGKATAYEFAQAGSALVESRSNAAQARFDYLFAVKILDFYRGERIIL